MKKEANNFLDNGSKAMQEAVQATLETLTFAEALPISGNETTQIVAPLSISTVEVYRPYAGYIRMTMAKSLANNLVGAMIGRSDTLEDNWLADGLAELINTIGGRILASLVKVESSFDLGIPSVIYTDKTEEEKTNQALYQTFVVNEDQLTIELNLTNQF